MRVYLANISSGREMKIFLAHSDGAQGDNNLMGDGKKCVDEWRDYKPSRPPSLLISYFYFGGFWKYRKHYYMRDWIMDSGAFSAHNSGKEINLQEYIDTCKKVKDTDKLLKEIYSLDVIGDWKATEKNTRIMWKAGIEAIPTFHGGEPWDVLVGLAKDYDKIGIGGVARNSGLNKVKFLEKCFSLVWPKKIHAFGCVKYADKFPFHSVDSTTWELSACAFGRWAKFGNLSVRGSKQNLRSQVEYYLDLEDKLNARWKSEMELLDGSC